MPAAPRRPVRPSCRRRATRAQAARRELERCEERLWIGLRRAGARRGDDRREERRSPSRSSGRAAEVPVPDDGQLEPEAPEPLQRVGNVRQHGVLGVQRGDVRLRREGRAQRLVEDAAQSAYSSVGMASRLDGVLHVVRRLGAERALDRRRLGPGRRRASEPTGSRSSTQRPERVDGHASIVQPGPGPPTRDDTGMPPRHFTRGRGQRASGRGAAPRRDPRRARAAAVDAARKRGEPADRSPETAAVSTRATWATSTGVGRRRGAGLGAIVNEIHVTGCVKDLGPRAARLPVESGRRVRCSAGTR